MEQNSKNYYYLKNNQNISQYISHVIESQIKTKPNQILLSYPIFIREDNSTLFTFFHQLKSPYFYISFISLLNSNDNKTKEIKIQFKKEKDFSFGEINISYDKKHLIILNEKRNKAYFILNFIEEIIIKNSDNIELEESKYFEIEKGKILNIKFSNTDDNEDTIIYGIYSDINILSIFNNKYMNKEFQIYLNSPLVDFQIVKINKNEYDLFMFDVSGNFRCIKNIQDIKNIPKNDNSNLLHKIEIYDRILYNINNMNIINEYKNCYLQNFFIDNNINIISVIRSADNFMDIGVLINDKIFIIKKYSFNSDEKEIIDKIIPINNEINKYLIKTDKNVYLLDMPSLSILFMPLSVNKNKNNKQDVLLIINEIISKINLSLLLKLPSQINNNNFAINYNFYNDKILCIKNNYPNVVVKIYDFEIEYANNKKDDSNIKIENNNKLNDTKILMQNLLTSMEQEKEIFINNEINQNQKEEYYNKILEELYNNININSINNNSNTNINESIELMKDWYINAYTNIKLYGDLIKNKYSSMNDNIEKMKTFSGQIKKSDEIVDNMKKNIENKFKILEHNEQEISQLKKENDKLINDLYIKNANVSQEEKIYANELIKKMNNYIIKNIKYVENNLINNDELLSSINFESIKSFPLTMKYLDESQKEKIKSLIGSINNLMNTFKNFHEKIKENEKEK